MRTWQDIIVAILWLVLGSGATRAGELGLPHDLPLPQCLEVKIISICVIDQSSVLIAYAFV